MSNRFLLAQGLGFLFVFFTVFRQVLDLQIVTSPQNLWRCITLVLGR